MTDQVIHYLVRAINDNIVFQCSVVYAINDYKCTQEILDSLRRHKLVVRDRPSITGGWAGYESGPMGMSPTDTSPNIYLYI
ncbi:hypothetical protein Pint_21572 [Pistacia integerrima]|uniref:Uncharacterized protein n=1 Tax=Pistacia integerrima TaxID=434235 RepID=A0ACC0XDQ9_9ROSI|nr:hypothetical protein Pint_21572 [Pistacia integerrima]